MLKSSFTRSVRRHRNMPKPIDKSEAINPSVTKEMRICTAMRGQRKKRRVRVVAAMLSKQAKMPAKLAENDSIPAGNARQASSVPANSPAAKVFNSFTTPITVNVANSYSG